MTGHPLGGVPDRLEQIGTAISDTLFRSHGERVGEVLVRAGVVHPNDSLMLRQSGVSEQQLDVFAVLSLYGDCLSLMVLACANARQPVAWERLEGLRPLLQRIGGYFAGVNTKYKEFRVLPREKIGELLNVFASSREMFGLLHPSTHWQGLRLCAHLAPTAGPQLLRTYLDQVLLPIWQYAAQRTDVPEALAAEIWADFTSR